MNGESQTRQPYRLGLQISSGIDDEVSIPGTRRRSRASMQGVVAGDCDEQGNADLCGGHKSRSCAHVDRDTTPALGIESSAIFEGKEFSPVALGVQALK